MEFSPSAISAPAGAKYSVRAAENGAPRRRVSGFRRHAPPRDLRAGAEIRAAAVRISAAAEDLRRKLRARENARNIFHTAPPRGRLKNGAVRGRVKSAAAFPS